MKGWHWALIGVGVVAAGAGGYYWYQKSKVKRPDGAAPKDTAVPAYPTATDTVPASYNPSTGEAVGDAIGAALEGNIAGFFGSIGEAFA